MMQVYISKDDQHWGPYDAAQMSALVERGSFSLQDWAWVDGSGEWVPLRQIMDALRDERNVESQVLHQKVEAAKDLWRSKLTQPTPAVFREERARKGRSTRKILATTPGRASGGRLGRNVFCGALAVGLAGFVAMLALSGPEEAEVEALQDVNGLKFKVDSAQPFDGRAVSHYPSGQLKHEAEYRDGLRHGRVVSFYPDGAKESEGTMEGGVYHGNVTFYHPDGQVKSKLLYHRGSAVRRENRDEGGEVLLRSK